jgi:hypothetical protein
MFEIIITLAVIAIGIVLCNIMVDMKATRAYLEALCEGEQKPISIITDFDDSDLGVTVPCYNDTDLDTLMPPYPKIDKQ